MSLVAGEIFVSEHLKNKSNPKFLHLVSEIVVSAGHLPKQVLIEGSEGQQTMSADFSWAKILSATSEMHGIEEIRLLLPLRSRPH